MAYASKFDELEREYGKPIGEILVDKLNDVGTIEKLARDIGMSYRHVFQKVKDCHIEKDVTYRLPEAAHEPTA